MRTELLTTLKRKTSEIISEVQTAQTPVLITQHGLPAAYLVDVASYEETQQRIALLEGIARGERALDEGRSVTHAVAKQRMKRWLS